MRHLLSALRHYADKPLWDDSHLTQMEQFLPSHRKRGAPHHEKLGQRVASTVYETSLAHGHSEREALARADASLESFRNATLWPLYMNESVDQTHDNLSKSVKLALKTGLSLESPPLYEEVPIVPPKLRQEQRLQYRAAENVLLRDAHGRFASPHGSIEEAVSHIAPPVYHFDGDPSWPTRDQIRQRLVGGPNFTTEAPAPKPMTVPKKVLN